MPEPERTPPPDAVDLYWLPLGAGGRWVRWNGRGYEALVAWQEHRARRDLYHCALEVSHRGSRFVIEMGPVWNVPDDGRGVVCEGPVGDPLLGRHRWFRYEVRCWRDGVIPDIGAAVGGPERLTSDPSEVAALLEAVHRVPRLTWGRDELHTGEMWNSNSVIAWLLCTAGLDLSAVQPPANGRAPGWRAGLVLVARSVTRSSG